MDLLQSVYLCPIHKGLLWVARRWILNTGRWEWIVYCKKCNEVLGRCSDNENIFKFVEKIGISAIEILPNKEQTNAP
jgi:hypothetical protein